MLIWFAISLTASLYMEFLTSMNCLCGYKSHICLFTKVDCNRVQEKSLCKGWEYPLLYMRCFMFENMLVGC